MNGVVARRNNFNEHILGFLEQCYAEFGRLTGRHYGFLTEYKTADADTVFVSLGCAAENIEAACDYLREQRNAKVGSIHINVIRPVPRGRGHQRPARQEKHHHPRAHRRSRSPGTTRFARDIRVALGKARRGSRSSVARSGLPALTPAETPPALSRRLWHRFARLPPGAHPWRLRIRHRHRPPPGRTYRGRRRNVLRAGRQPPLRRHQQGHAFAAPRQGAIAVRFHSIGGWGMITTGKNLGSIIGDFGKFHLGAESPSYDADGHTCRTNFFVMANPKYGSEKERRADQLLSHRRPVADQGELRAEPCGRRALLRPEGLHAHQPARGPEEGRLASSGNPANRPRSRGSACPSQVPPVCTATTKSASSSCRVSTSRGKPPARPSCSSACRAIPSSARFSAYHLS